MDVSVVLYIPAELSRKMHTAGYHRRNVCDAPAKVYGNADGALQLVASDIRRVDCAFQTAHTNEQHHHNLPLQTTDRDQVDNQGHMER